MNEGEAVRKSLLMCGFLFGGQTFFFEDTDKQVYIPTDLAVNFSNIINYCQTFAFYKHCNKEERKIYYRTARRLEKLKERFFSTAEF